MHGAVMGAQMSMDISPQPFPKSACLPSPDTLSRDEPDGTRHAMVKWVTPVQGWHVPLPLSQSTKSTHVQQGV